MAARRDCYHSVEAGITWMWLFGRLLLSSAGWLAYDPALDDDLSFPPRVGLPVSTDGFARVGAYLGGIEGRNGLGGWNVQCSDAARWITLGNSVRLLEVGVLIRAAGGRLKEDVAWSRPLVYCLGEHGAVVAFLGFVR